MFYHYSILKISTRFKHITNLRFSISQLIFVFVNQAQTWRGKGKCQDGTGRVLVHMGYHALTFKAQPKDVLDCEVYEHLNLNSAFTFYGS